MFSRQPAVTVCEDRPPAMAGKRQLVWMKLHTQLVTQKGADPEVMVSGYVPHTAICFDQASQGHQVRKVKPRDGMTILKPKIEQISQHDQIRIQFLDVVPER
jgi:hypothetical protein